MAAAAVVGQDVRRREAGVRRRHAHDVGDSARGSAGEHPAQRHGAGEVGRQLLCGCWLPRPLGAGFLKARLVCSYVLSCGIVFAVVIVIIVADVGVSLHDIPFNHVLTVDVNV